MNLGDILSAAMCLALPLAGAAGVLVLGSGSKAGVYIYRTRKPGALFGWPVVGRHVAYVGQTKSFGHRHRQHTGTPRPWDPYARTGQPWSDLNPVCYRIPLPPWRWLLLLVEWMLIKTLLPVYNIKHNKTNPRKITAYRALQMRATRDKARMFGRAWWLARTVAALRWYHYVATVVLVAGVWGWAA